MRTTTGISERTTKILKKSVTAKLTTMTRKFKTSNIASRDSKSNADTARVDLKKTGKPLFFTANNLLGQKIW